MAYKKSNLNLQFLILLCVVSLLLCINAQQRNYDEGVQINDRRRPQQSLPSKAPSDPCHPNSHGIIQNQPQRSYNYRLGSGPNHEDVLCDRDLRRGWYRFSSLAGDIIPTSCPGNNYCGTRAPVWMKGLIPSVEEGIVKVAGCVSVQGKCCTTQLPMFVKNCTGFVVYHLESTPACPSAYCAGYEVPCPLGLSSETGYTPCHFPVDLVETKVSYSYSKDKNRLHFFCDVTLGGHVVPESVALEVEWLVDEDSVQSETFGLTQQHKGLLKEDKWSIGQILQCRARARHTTINTFTSAMTSPPFQTGIVLNSPSTMTLTEGGQPGFIEFETKTPIICSSQKKKKGKNNKNGDDTRRVSRTRMKDQHDRSKRRSNKSSESEDEEGSSSCCVTWEISIRNVNSPRCPDGNQLDLVVVGGCNYKVCDDEWNSTQRIPIWAMSDGLIHHGINQDTPSSVQIEIRSVEPSPKRWQDITFPSLEIKIQSADVDERCRISDGTMTFDDVTYKSTLEGTFVLYRHNILPYEVQIQLKQCSYRPICTCAIAIRFGDAMLAAEICSTGKLRLWSHTAEGVEADVTKLHHLPQILRVDEGRSFQVQFPTGTRVNWGPNLRFIQIQASVRDFDETSGLCGSFDHNPSNDLIVYGEQGCNNASSCEDFSKAWRLLPEQSLFQGVFSNEGSNDAESDLSNVGHCSCSGSSKSGVKVELRPKSKSKYSSYQYEEYEDPNNGGSEADGGESKCYTQTCGDPRGIDVTTQLLEILLDEDFVLNHKFNPVHLMDIKPSFKIPDSTRTLETSSKLTEEDSEVFCLHMIEGVPAAKLCRDVAHIDVDIHTKACKNEVLVSGDPGWSMDALEELRWECRDQIYHNVTLWEPQLGHQYGTPPLALLSSLCLNNCSNKGSCHNGICNCQRGRGGSDCSVDVNESPMVTNLEGGGVCDIRQRPCSQVLVWGSPLTESGSIKCHYDIYRTTNAKSIPTLGGSLVTEGRLLTFQSIICDVPELPIHEAKIASFYIPGEGIDKTRTLLRLSLSYGIGSRSQGFDYTIYDSLCWVCETPLTCKPSPTQSCNVLTEPFGGGGNLDLFGGLFGSFSDGESIGNLPIQPSPDASRFQETQPFSLRNQLHPNPCQLKLDAGSCRNEVVRFYWDGTKCRPFIFGGCEGNGNNFNSEDDCKNSCFQDSEKTLPDKCTKDKYDSPSCKDPTIIQYYYDAQERRCRPLIGCELIHFPSKGGCIAECRQT